jgi:hypothetical protein
MKAPQAPDPAQVAQQSQATNLQTAQNQLKLNAPLGNNSNAYGSNTVNIDPSTGLPTGQTQTMAPWLTQLLGQRSGLASGINNAQSGILSNLPTGGINQNFNDAANNAAKAAFGAQTNFLNPQFALQNKQLSQQLDDRGLPIGSEARTDATNNQQNQENLAYTQAANNAYGAGLQAQNQGFNQAVTNQNLPYNQLGVLAGINPTSSLLGAAPGAANLNPANVANTNVGGIYQNSYEDALKAQQANSGQLFGGLLGLGTLGLSGGTAGFGGSMLGTALGYGSGGSAQPQFG